MKTILLFILLLFPFSVEAKTEVNEHLIDAEIEIAGALRVKEIIVVSGNQESFSRTLNYKNVKEDWDGKTIDLNDLSMYNGYSLENIKVSAFPYEKGIDLNYETEDFLEELNVKKKKKNYYIKTDNDLGTNIEIFYENKKSNKTVYYIEYLVSNVMVMHNDITELNYTFKNLNYMSKETKLRIINPYPTDSKLFHVWMHGPKSGDLQYLINDNEEKVGIISSFKDLDVDLNVRITLPKEHVGIDIYLNKTDKDALKDIITIEDNIMNYKTKPFVILKYILIVLSVLYVLGSFILFKCSTKSINILYLFLGFLIILFNKIFKYNIIYLYFIPLIPVIILCIKNKLIKRENQNEKRKTKKRKNKTLFYKIISFILVVLTVFVFGLIIYFNIIPIKYLIPIVIVFSLVVYLITTLLNKKTKSFIKGFVAFIAVIILFIESLGVFYAFGTLDFLNKIVDEGYRIETYNIYVLKESKYEKLKDINNQKITFYKQETDIYKEAISKLQKKIDYESIISEGIPNGVNKVLEKETEGLFISESLMDIYKEDHLGEYEQLRILYSIEVLTKSEKKLSKVDITKEPFVIYLSGVDAGGNIQKSARSDVNILAVVNPKSGKILLVNTPRDYYVMLATKNAKDKLTHAGIYGIEESALTLGNLYNIDINYYARVNFTSFVDIINSLNGITVDSKYAFSTDGYSFKKGENKLTGASALAFSRERNKVPGGDRGRGENQQAVLIGLINKLSDPKILIQYSSLLNSFEKGIITNLEKKDITKFINMMINKNIKWETESISVSGSNSHNTTYSTGSYTAYVMEPYSDDISEAKIKINETMAN